MTRLSTGLTLLASMALVAGCSGGMGETTSPTPSASPGQIASPPPSASPTDPTPTPSATHPTGRNTAMTDAEALARMTEPQTGEHWFGAPRLISTPDWVADDPDYGGDWAHWFELGDRAGATILGVVDGWDELTLIAEHRADGSDVQIDYPSPNEPRPNDDPAPDLGISHDVDTYYDSFALPEHLALASGTPLRVPASYGLIGRVPAAESVTSAGRVGAFEIVRYDAEAEFAWSETPPAGLTFSEWYYLLRSPWGSEITLEYAPFDGYGSVTWLADSSYTPSDRPGPVDLFDSSCGGAPLAPVTVVHGLADRDWVAAGTTERGETLYLAAADNPLVDPVYRAYLGLRTEGGDPVVTRDEWIRDRGLVAYKTPASGSWVVYLDAGLSGRVWC